MEDSLKSKVVSATKWSVLAEITAKLAAPVVNMFLARMLSPSSFGVVASITIVTSFADIFTDAGFQKYVIQHDYKTKSELDKNSNVAFTSNFILSSCIFGFIIISRNSIASAIGCADASLALAVASISILCTSFSSILIARFNRDLNFRPLFFVRLLSSFVPLLVTVPLAWYFKSYWALVLGTVSQQLFISIFTVIISDYKPKLYFNVSIFKEMLSFSVWNLLETLSIWFTGQASIFIVANLLDSHYLGLYRTGMTTINSYMTLLTAAVTPVLFSALSRYQNDDIMFKETFDRFQKLLSLFVIPLGVGIFLYRDLVVYILLGESWTQISFFMGLWALMSALTIILSNLACEVYRSKGLPKISFVLQIVYLIYYIPSIYFSAKSGFIELCLVSCLVRLVPIILDLLVLHFKFNIRLKEVFSNIWYKMFASGIMYFIGLALQKISSNFIWSFIVIGICAILYFILMYINPETRNELKGYRKFVTF